MNDQTWVHVENMADIGLQVVDRRDVLWPVLEDLALLHGGDQSRFAATIVLLSMRHLTLSNACHLELFAPWFLCCTLSESELPRARTPS